MIRESDIQKEFGVEPLRHQTDHQGFFGDGVLDSAFDIGEGLLAGAERAGQSIYSFLDFATFDLLPDWDEPGLFTPDTGAGKIVAGFSQFAVPYFGTSAAIAKGAGLAMRLGRGRGFMQWLNGSTQSSAVQAFRQARLSGRGPNALIEAALVAGKGGVGRAAVKGGITDFLAFNESEERLSNLVQSVPELANPVTAFLSADEDDGVITGRLKNVLEGAGLGLALDGVIDTLRASRAHRKVRAAGGTPEEAGDAAMRALDDSRESRVAQQRADEDIRVRNEDNQDFDLGVDDEGNTITRKGSDIERMALVDHEKMLIDLDETELSPTGPFRTQSENLLDETGPEIPDTGIGTPPTSEESLTAFNIADEARLTRDLDFRNNPLRLTAAERRAQGVDEDGVNMAMKMGSDKYVAALVRAIERNTETVKVTASNRRQLAQAVRDAGRLAGFPMDKFAGAIMELGEDADRIAQAARRAMMFRAYGEVLGQQIKPQLDTLASKPNISQQEIREVYAGLKAFMTIQDGVRNTFSEFGRGLQQASILLDADKLAKKFEGVDTYRPIDELREAAENAAAFDAERVHQIMKDMQGVVGSENPMDNILAAQKLLEAPFRTKALAVAQEYHISALLSGVSTHVVNSASALFMSFWRPIENAIGARWGMLLGDDAAKEVWNEEVSTLANMFSSFQEAYQLMKQSGGTPFGSESMIEGPRFSPSAALAARSEHSTFWSPLVHAIQTPTRALEYMDSYFKTANGLARSRAVMANRMMQQGLDPSEIPARVQEMQQVILSNRGDLRSQAVLAKELSKEGVQLPDLAGTPGLTGERARKLAEFSDPELDTLIEAHEKGVRAGKEATFTTKLDDQGIISRGGMVANMATQRIPALKFFLPFVKTPVNIAEYGWDRTVGAVLGGMTEGARKTYNALNLGPEWKATEQSFLKLQRELASPDPQIRAQARSRTAFAMSAVPFLLHAASQQDDDGMWRVTGTGPADPDAQKVLRASGWQPFSIRVGNNYVSYQRLDPVASMLGVLVDAAETLREGINDSETGFFQAVAGSVFVSVTNNITNKSYLKGLKDLMDFVSDPEGQYQRVSQNLVGSFVPSLAAGIEKAVDPEMQSVRGLMDKIRSRTPGLSSTLPVRRDLLGQPIKIDDPITQLILPVRISQVKDDVVGAELGRFAYGFSEAGTTRGGIDLLADDFIEDGQTAYDRYVELSGEVRIGGKDLRQALRVLIKSDRYQRIDPDKSPDGEISPRIGEIQKVIRRYRNAAWTQVQKERPSIRTSVRQVAEDRRARKLGKLTL